jgi:acyl-CoA dehydrogenase
VINGPQGFITGMKGASVGIVMAKAAEGACMFLVDLPHPAIRIEDMSPTPSTVRCPAAMPPSRSTICAFRPTRCWAIRARGSNMPRSACRPRACRTACAGWLLHPRARDRHRLCQPPQAFGKALIDHEGRGLHAGREHDRPQAVRTDDRLVRGRARHGSLGTVESSMAKVAVSEALMRVADRCVQVMGGMGVTDNTIVEQVFREIRAFRIYDGPTEVHKWSLAKKIKRDWKARTEMSRQPDGRRAFRAPPPCPGGLAFDEAALSAGWARMSRALPGR